MGAITAPSSVRSNAARATLVATMLLTIAIVLAWGHFKLLDQDEVFVMQTDSVRSVHELVEVQRHYPISLDPLVYHLLGHASVKVFGAVPLALRLPSLAGFLLMEICLFGLVRSISGERAAAIAAAIPMLTLTVYYGMQARPYGVLLGLTAAMLWSYHRAVRAHASGAAGGRSGALIGLFATLALALNTHYFAVLLLIPLYGAELVRTAYNRRLDWPVVAAIGLGSAAIGLALPFQRAAGEFRKHYYNGGTVGLHAVTQSYRSLFLNYTDYSLAVQHMIAAVLAVLVIALVFVLWRVYRSSAWPLLLPETVYLLLLAALPFAGFLLARFVTHSIETRYVLPAIVGLAVLFALALQPQRWSPSVYGVAICFLLMSAAMAGVVRVEGEREKRNETLASLIVPANVRDRLLAEPHARLYAQNMGMFDERLVHIADPAIRSRLVLLYSSDEELRFLRHDTNALTALHMQYFLSQPVERYEDLKKQPGEHLVLLYNGSGWDWTDKALQADGAHITAVGNALGGRVVSVQFPEVQP
jgi:4-amino-4-deoxy-L-arabinose transferase-like glycosyltransferase